MLDVLCTSSLEKDLTVLIDYEKYMKLNGIRKPKQQFPTIPPNAIPNIPGNGGIGGIPGAGGAPGSIPGVGNIPSLGGLLNTVLPGPNSTNPYPNSGQGGPGSHSCQGNCGGGPPPCHGDCGGPHNEKPICNDPHNEVYQECGSKCVLGCRYASVSSGSVTFGKRECDTNDCVEGCFCKTGLVRHQNKCIPALECPIRKCHHRDEVYVSKSDIKKEDKRLIQT